MGYRNEKAAAANEAFFRAIDGGNEKKAADAATEYTRVYMREESFTDKILPPVTVGNEDLDRQVDTDKPVIVVDKEPNSPEAISVPFGQTPVNRYIRGPRYRVVFNRIESTRFTKDVEELRSYDMDIRQVLSDNSVKDMAAEKDGRFIAIVDAIVKEGGQTLYAEIGAPESGDGLTAATPTDIASGKTRDYILIDPDGITRSTLVEMTKIQPATQSRLETQSVLTNMITIKEVLKFSRDEMGGDLAEEVLLNGWTERTFLNCRWIITIKRNLVPNNVFYMFAEPKFLGKHFLLEDTTMFIEKKAFLLNWFSYMTLGLTIANVNGAAKCLITRTDPNAP